MAQPNTAFQPTPLRGPKIVDILQSGFVLTLVPIYRAARLNADRSAALITVVLAASPRR